MDGNDVIPFFKRHLQQRAVANDTCVIHHRIHAAEGADGGVDEGIRRRRLGHAARDHAVVHAHGFQRRGRFRKGSGTGAIDHHLCPKLPEAHGARAPNTPRRPRHHHPQPVDAVHCCSPFPHIAESLR